MIIQWFNIYNKATFETEDLVSKKFLVDMGDLGENEVLLTKGNHIGLLYNDVFLYVDEDGENPFQFCDQLIHIDDSDDIWLGVVTE